MKFITSKGGCSRLPSCLPTECPGQFAGKSEVNVLVSNNSLANRRIGGGKGREREWI